MLCDSYCKVYWVRFVVGFHIYQTYTLSIYHTIYNYEPIHIYIILYMTMNSSTVARISLQFEDHLLCAPCLRMQMARRFGRRMTASSVINRGLAAECQSQCPARRPSLTLQHRQHHRGRGSRGLRHCIFSDKSRFSQYPSDSRFRGRRKGWWCEVVGGVVVVVFCWWCGRESGRWWWVWLTVVFNHLIEVMAP